MVGSNHSRFYSKSFPSPLTKHQRDMDLVSIWFFNNGEQHIMIFTLPLPPKDKKVSGIWLKVTLMKNNEYLDFFSGFFEEYVFKALLAVRKNR